MNEKLNRFGLLSFVSDSSEHEYIFFVLSNIIFFGSSLEYV
jgi:hypothetical protein